MKLNWNALLLSLSFLIPCAFAEEHKPVLVPALDCKVYLELEIYDDNVRPPLAWVTSVMDFLQAGPDVHTVSDRDANRLGIYTRRPQDVLVGRGSRRYITSVKNQAGHSIPAFHPPISPKDLPPYHFREMGLTPNDGAFDREAHFRIMGLLPAGLYVLRDTKGQLFSLVVNFYEAASSPRWSAVAREFALSAEIWPGVEFLPRREAHFMETMLHVIDTRPGVGEGINFTFEPHAVTLNGGIQTLSSFYDSLRFIYDENGRMTHIEASASRRPERYEVLDIYQYRSRISRQVGL